ncbi:hypothetical protein C1I95_21790 [Micromonospora craterilacus]|uniref:F5/8 type C domain-containing protein n=1 Tax=Micromonospora craterilacus TaxID=1655439 RepID=A0A2W2DR08_9ACTN|nr:hypothetical protein [Micromonospora craterilacus]PZG14426.1 hypothetical protein C1I95_21790 [Micromonospora craterilacus]
MRSDLISHLAPAQTLRPASQADPSVPVNGIGVDLANHDSAVVLVDAGTITGAGASLTVEVQHSDDNSAWTAVPDDELTGAEPVITSANHQQIHQIGYRGIKRYLRVAITAKAGTTPTLLVGATVVRGKPRRLPA